MTRRRQPIHRDLLESALRHHASLPVRSDLHKRFLDHFVDVGQLQQLRNPDWQVVFGRRGTGKTLLLGALEAQAQVDFGTDRVLSLLFTAQDFLISPIGLEVPDKIRALGYFQTFIDALATRLSRSVDELLGDPGFLRSMTGQRVRAKSRIEDLILKIMVLSQIGEPVAAFDTIEWSDNGESSLTDSARAEAHLRAELTPELHAAGVGFGWGRSQQRQQRRTVSWHEKGPAVPRLPLVRRHLLELLEEMSIEHLNILIDEWSALDPTGATAIQPEFAESLKRTFAGTDLVSVKIATNRYQTRFSNQGAAGQYRGLELGADVFEAVNLDRSSLDEENLIRFHERLLYKRLRVSESGLEVFETRGSGQPDEQFVLSIFHDRRAFRELVRGSEGVPRRFLLTFNALSQACSHSLDRLWDASFVQQRIREISLAEESDIAYHSEASQLLSVGVKTIVSATGSRAFFVQRQQYGALESAIEELLEKRLIHEYPRAKLPPQIRESYEGYLVDYGLWLDWERGLRGVDVERDEALLPLWTLDLDRNTINSLTVSPLSVDRDMLTCQSCHARFPKDSRSYQVKGLCPECFEPAG